MKGHALCTLVITAVAFIAGPGLVTARDDGMEEALRKNSLAIALGSLKEDPGEDDTQVSVEYVRWMDHDFGVGVDLDFVDSSKMVRDWAVAVPFHLKFKKYFDFYAGPGYESRNSALVSDDDDDEFFFRLGLGMQFELGQGGWFIEPQVEADLFRNDHKYFFGVGAGYRF